jgi:hypothetical protein
MTSTGQSCMQVGRGEIVVEMWIVLLIEDRQAGRGIKLCRNEYAAMMIRSMLVKPRVRAPRSVCSNSANRLNQHFTHGMPKILSSDLSSFPECNRLHQVIVRNTSKNIHPRSGDYS